MSKLKEKRARLAYVFACTSTRAFSYKKQAHATVANEDFKTFENKLKASDRQEQKSPLIWVTNEQNI